jgi:6-phosphofructokinase 1
MKAHDFDKAVELRGPEYKEMLAGFYATALLANNEARLPKDKASIM